MPWTWIRPLEPSILDGRPLLDIGCGDCQAVMSLSPEGPVTCLDRSVPALTAARRAGCGRLVCGEAEALPLAPGFRTVLAADLFHHLDDHHLGVVLGEVRRILRADGVLVAWWYGEPPRPSIRGSTAPRHARSFESVARIASEQGLDPRPLELQHSINPAPPTAGMAATPTFD